MEVIVCSECNIEKMWDDVNFYRNKARNQLYRICKACWYKKSRKWAEDHPERVKDISNRSMLRLRYGTTPEENQAKFEEQGSCCAICKTTSPGRRHWATDHDHETNKNRGILCDHCNNGLGHFKDSPEAMREAALYVEKWKRLHKGEDAPLGGGGG